MDVLALRARPRVLRARLEVPAVEFSESQADADAELVCLSEYRDMRSRVVARLAKLDYQTADADRVDVLGPLSCWPRTSRRPERR